MYILDTNIYISFYERCYPYKNFPSFWDKIGTVLSNEVIIPKIVIDEAYQNEWFVDDFLPNAYDKSPVNHVSYSEGWSEVLNHINNSGLYKDSALTSARGWGNSTIADAWIIAIAKKEGATIVTDELSNRRLDSVNLLKECKIPDIANDLHVRCIRMLDFFDEVELIV